MKRVRADSETRTRDPRLGKPMLCQLSYIRKCLAVNCQRGGVKNAMQITPCTMGKSKNKNS